MTQHNMLTFCGDIYIYNLYGDYVLRCHAALQALWHHTERLAFSTRGEELMDIADRQRQDVAGMLVVPRGEITHVIF